MLYVLKTNGPKNKTWRTKTWRTATTLDPSFFVPGYCRLETLQAPLPEANEKSLQ
jgi:hypothetical protein